MHPYTKDITGKRFGDLTAIAPAHRTLSSGRRMPAWTVECDCGNRIICMTVNLTKGKHRSCGCKRSELTCETRGFEMDTHKPEYRVHSQMVDRCYLKTAPNYRWYGAKGVTVCDRWLHGDGGRTGFQCFYEDMGPRPDGLTLDRIDPWLDYSPDNCRWATWQEQGKNKRCHHVQAESA